MSEKSGVTKCLDCGGLLTVEMRKCPNCGSTARAVVIPDTGQGLDDKMRLQERSEDKDQRGKPLREADRKFKGNVEKIIMKDRSKRLKGIPETDVYHEVKRNGKTVHPPHLEPKGKKKTREIKKG